MRSAYRSFQRFATALSAQLVDYGLGHTIRQNYHLKVSPRYKRLVHDASRFGLGKSFKLNADGLSVHMLLCKRDLIMGMCAAVSFLESYKGDASLTFHDDGSLGEEDVSLVLNLLPGVRIIRRAQADFDLDHWLASYPLSRSLRRQCFMLVKFFDPLFYGKGDWRLLLDSDVMFFRSPDKIRQIVESGVPGNWFNKDIASSYCIDSSVATRLLGKPIHERLNAGLALIHKDSIDLTKCDEFLAACDFIKRPWIIEQTLHAMFSTVFGVSHLPDEYELNTSRFASANAVSKHYVGRMTEMFFLDGFRRLAASRG